MHVKHRETARALVINTSGQILLIKTHWDPGTGLPPRWLTPGGGIDAGESIAQAAMRELWEELGLRVSIPESETPDAALDFRIEWGDGRFETGVAHFFRVQVDDTFVVDNSNWTLDEHRDVIELRWWTPEEILSSDERFGPPGLLELIRANLTRTALRR